MAELYLPALRGIFGDWVYYASLMSLRELASRVDFARVIHKSERLSDLIQRKLRGDRAKDIADYLSTKERFFNALVIAVYGGDPGWLDVGRLTPAKGAMIDVTKIPETVYSSLGLLRLTGKEKLFAVDGQHRLAGIKEAIKTTPTVGDDDVAIVLVGHKTTPAGMQRTRRLFTILNKAAKPVGKGEIIALDEDDVMAICVRRLVEENPYFKDKRIAYNTTNNLAVNDFASLTTIGNLYDVLTVLFLYTQEGTSKKSLTTNRPKDNIIDGFYAHACLYFDLLARYFRSLGAFFRVTRVPQIVRKHRRTTGGHVLFRPLGLLVITEVIVRLAQTHSLADSVRRASRLPVDLQKAPYKDVLWDGHLRRIEPKGKTLVRSLLLYMLGEEEDVRTLARKYELQLGRPGEGMALLRRLHRLPKS